MEPCVHWFTKAKVGAYKAIWTNIKHCFALNGTKSGVASLTSADPA